MTCPRCQSATVAVVWVSSTVETDKPPVRTEEHFDRCPSCGWQENFYQRKEDQ